MSGMIRIQIQSQKEVGFMKRKSSRGLALLLTLVLAGASGMLPAVPVSAETGNNMQNTGVQKPEVRLEQKVQEIPK